MLIIVPGIIVRGQIVLKIEIFKCMFKYMLTICINRRGVVGLLKLHWVIKHVKILNFNNRLH